MRAARRSAAPLSNGCATRGEHCDGRAGYLLSGLYLLCFSRPARAWRRRSPLLTQKTSDEHRDASIPTFLAGAAIGFGAHEAGHLLFDGIFNANPGVKKVSFHGMPFFAITHDNTLPPRQEFVIDSAGFWVQQSATRSS